MKYYVGEIASRNCKEDFVEDTFGIPYSKKVIDYKNKRYAYYNCLISETQLKAMKPHHQVELAWSIEEVEVPNLFKLYSDGASFNNGKKKKDLPEYGSYGCILTYNGEELEEKTYGEENWTNNIGELSGAMEAIRLLVEEYDLSGYYGDKVDVILITDSQYVSKGCTTFMDGWVKRGWRNNSGQPTPNKPLWEKMRKLLQNETINLRFQWVRGHTLLSDADSVFNERCDKLAGAYIKETFLS